MPEAFPLHLIIAIAAILLAARLFGVLFQRIGQPSVVGEMTAGIGLGPSFSGMLFPVPGRMFFPVRSSQSLPD
jgi:Kef-type K+ transport system membrane component KefB